MIVPRQDMTQTSAAKVQVAAIRAQQPVDTRTSIVRLLLGLCMLIAFASPSFAQSSAALMPENAHTKRHGDGWECDLGFRSEGDKCAAVKVPQNAYLTKRSYGSGWECLHGFLNTGGSSCDEVVVPEGGYLGPSGDKWHCMRRYQKIADTCRIIDVPENAYLEDTSYGLGWLCNRGFEVVGNKCLAIEVPENAFLNTSSYARPWTCERGFFERNGRCAAIVLPENAYLADVTYGNRWKCERGYASVDDRCDAIDLPENAHLDRSGNRWECNRNFRNTGGLCVLNN